MRSADDRECETTLIENVRDASEAWEISVRAGWTFGLEKKYGKKPRVGDSITTWGGLGYPIRGVAINGELVYYRTPEEENERHQRWVADKRQRDRAEYEKREPEYRRRIAALPAQFQERFARFERNAANAWNSVGYELAACEDAVKIARQLGSTEKIREFAGLPWESQLAAVPDLDQGHSGNTFSMACRLASLFVDKPELIDKMHATICALIGCKEAGCSAAENDA